ncbi:MAG: sigma-70 family RNA polymerase sigma factor [Bacteroidetes bacterium]|nr:sigma-70 family RNA polymerase sigma factor [Bacteroidota bacterium]
MASWKRFEQIETEVLIDYIQDPKVVDAIRDDAFLAICFRFRGDLIEKCEVICKRKGHDLDVAIEIANNTLEIYGRSKGFKADRSSKSAIDDAFRFYLYKIAANELKDYYKREKKKKEGKFYDGSEEIVTQLPEVDLNTLDAANRAIHHALAELPYSHQVIFLTYAVHEKEGVNLPRGLQKKLREHLGGISQNTVRTYKKEAKDKMDLVKAVIDEIRQES